MVIAILAVIGFAMWYILYGAECAINGATCHPGNQFLMPFRCFYEELLWVLPGAYERKAQYIKDSMGNCENGSMCGSKNSWSYQDIRANNLYGEVGKDMLPGLVHFILMHILLPGIPLYIRAFFLWS